MCFGCRQALATSAHDLPACQNSNDLNAGNAGMRGLPPAKRATWTELSFMMNSCACQPTPKHLPTANKSDCQSDSSCLMESSSILICRYILTIFEVDHTSLNQHVSKICNSYGKGSQFPNLRAMTSTRAWQEMIAQQCQNMSTRYLTE